MKIAIIGQGYVGLTISTFAAEHFEVVGFDSNQKIVDNLNLGISHIEGVQNSKLQSLIKSGKYNATTKGSDIQGSEIVVIAVPTPLTPDRKPDLSFIDAACKTIGQNLSKPVLVINESTSFPGTLRSFIKTNMKSILQKWWSIHMRFHQRESTQAEMISIRRTPHVCFRDLLLRLPKKQGSFIPNFVTT